MLSGSISGFLDALEATSGLGATLCLLLLALLVLLQGAAPQRSAPPRPAQAMRPFGIVPGSRRNLSVPTHVAWMGGVMGATVDPSVQWSTDADGTMRSSAGETIVDYRPWESREQNLKRGVKPEQMKF